MVKTMETHTDRPSRIWLSLKIIGLALVIGWTAFLLFYTLWLIFGVYIR